jgi:hypothetical protein
MTVRVLSSCAASIAAVAISAPVALAADNDATKSPLRRQAHGRCDGTDFNAGVPQRGFAIIKQNGDGQVSVEVSVKNGPANAVYFVDVVQTPSGSGCNARNPNAELTINGKGNGNIHVDAPLVSGTTDAFVVLEPANSAAQASGNIASQDVVL